MRQICQEFYSVGYTRSHFMLRFESVFKTFFFLRGIKARKQQSSSIVLRNETPAELLFCLVENLKVIKSIRLRSESLVEQSADVRF